MANINTNVFVDTKKFVDFAGLDYFWGKVKTYVDGVDSTLNTTLSELSDKHNAYETKTDAVIKSIQDELSTLNGGVGSVGQQIENAIAALNLPTTYETIANVAALKTELTEAIATAKAGAETTAANALAAHVAEDIHVTAEQKASWTAAAEAIDVFLNDEVGKADVVDTLKEITDLINSGNETAAGLLADVAQNKTDIAANATAIETAKTNLTEAIAAAKGEAIAAAAEDAATKANAAKEAAIAAAAEDATTKANTAKSEAIAAAAEDATTKANAAKEAAIAAAKADVTETLKSYYSKTNIDEMVTAINQSIADNSVADQAYAKTYTDELFHSIKFATTTDIDGMTGF